MEMYDIYSRLRNDIINSKYPQAYYINQENDINTLNTHNKKGWRHCLDAYQIKVTGKTYNGNYVYDKEKDDEHKIRLLEFQSFSEKSGLDFLDFIDMIINGDGNIFVHLKGLEVCDLRKKLFDIKEITIRDTNIDNTLVAAIKKYFPKLENIRFVKCVIKNECDFSKIRTDIKFDESIIEDFRVFNDTKANIEFLRTKIKKISNTNVNSKTIEFRCINELIYKELFLKCNFKELENLIIYPDKNKVSISYGDQFMFLPKSAPKLENFSLDGKLDNFDFLGDLKNLLRCSINSIYDIHSSFYPDVVTSKERNKLLQRNLKEYEIQKILKPDEQDKYIIGRLELNRILRLASFCKLLNYSEEEQIFLQNNPNLIEYLIGQKIEDKEITKFYESYYDTLSLRNTDNDRDVRFGFEETYGLLSGILYIYKNYRPLQNTKEILLTKKFVYNYDNKPIIFMNRAKPIRTFEDAIAYREKYKYTSGWKEKDLHEYEYSQFLQMLSELKDSNEEITIGNLMDGISEVAGYNVKAEDFSKMGEGGKFIAGVLETYNRSDKRYSHIYDKNTHYRNLIKRLILENYEKFTISEKIFLLLDSEKYEIHGNKFAKTLDIYDMNNDYDESLISSIDYKTNGLYSKYFNMVRLTYEQILMQPKAYDLPVKKEYLKKLVLR